MKKFTFETYLESWDTAHYMQVASDLPNIVNPIVSLAFASFNFSSNGNLGGMPLTQSQITQLIDFIHQGKNGIAIISYGGATSPYYVTNSNKWPNTDEMAKCMVDSMKKYGFDGIDLDIEGDVGVSNYANNVISIVKKIRQLAPTIRLTVTIPAQGWNTPYEQIAKGVVDAVDCINFMEYDLWVDSSNTYQTQVDWDINYYQDNWGIPAEKIAVGIMPGLDDTKKNLSLADAKTITINAKSRSNAGVFVWDAQRDHAGQGGNISNAYTKNIMQVISADV